MDAFPRDGNPAGPPRNNRAYVGLLAGGRDHDYRGLRSKLFEEFGVDLVYHWEYKDAVRTIPADVEVVCILATVINHDWMKIVVRDAKDASLPLAKFTVQKSSWYRALEFAGFSAHPSWMTRVVSGVLRRPLLSEPLTLPLPGDPAMHRLETSASETMGIAEASRITSLSRQGIRNICDRGDIVCTRTADGARVLDRASVEDYARQIPARTSKSEPSVAVAVAVAPATPAVPTHVLAEPPAAREVAQMPSPPMLAVVGPVVDATLEPYARYLPYKPGQAWSDDDLLTLMCAAEVEASVDGVQERIWRGTGRYRTAQAVVIQMAACRGTKLKNPQLKYELNRMGRAKSALSDTFLAAEKRADKLGAVTGEWISRDLACQWFGAGDSRLGLALREGFVVGYIDRDLELMVVRREGALAARKRFEARLGDDGRLRPRSKVSDEDVVAAILEDLRVGPRSVTSIGRGSAERVANAVALLVKQGSVVAWPNERGLSMYALAGYTVPVVPAPAPVKAEPAPVTIARCPQPMGRLRASTRRWVGVGCRQSRPPTCSSRCASGKHKEQTNGRHDDRMDLDDRT